MSWAEINLWITQHQALVVAVGIPILTTISAGLVAWLSGKANLSANRKERELQKELRLSEYRQDWINQLREDLARFATFETQATLGIQDEQIVSLSEVTMRILMRMNPDDPEYGNLREAMAKTLKNAILEHGAPETKLPEDRNENPLDAERIVDISQRILKREWDRLKKDIEVSSQ